MATDGELQLLKCVLVDPLSESCCAVFRVPCSCVLRGDNSEHSQSSSDLCPAVLVLANC